MDSDQLAAVAAALDADQAALDSLDDAPWSGRDTMVFDCENRPLILWGGEPGQSIARLRNRGPALVALARAVLSIGSSYGHRECDDCWYSCPASADYCGNDDSGECTCGYSEIAAALADLIDSP